MELQRAFSQAFGTETIIAAVVFGLVLLTLLVAVGVSAHRRRTGKPASQRAEHNPLELSYLAVVAAVAGLAVFISFSTNAAYWHDPQPGMTVKVTAFQWVLELPVSAHLSAGQRALRGRPGAHPGTARRPAGPGGTDLP